MMGWVIVSFLIVIIKDYVGVVFMWFFFGFVEVFYYLGVFYLLGV